MIRRSDGKVAIGIDQIRQATQALQQTPLYGSIKIVLIEAADQMTLSAANSLLKILEEPPATRYCSCDRRNVAITTNRAVEMSAAIAGSTNCRASTTLVAGGGRHGCRGCDTRAATLRRQTISADA